MASPKTNPIGAGTVNIAVNVAEEERAVISKAAFGLNMSAGALMRRLILAGARKHDPELAARIKRIRQQRRTGALARILGWCGLLAPLAGMMGGIRFRKARQDGSAADEISPPLGRPTGSGAVVI